MNKIIPILLSAIVLSAASVGSNADKQDVMTAMDAYRNAMTHNDGAALSRLLADDLTYVHSDGLLETKADVIKSVVSGKAAVDKIEFLPDTDVRIHGKVAYVAGKEDLWHPKSTIHMHVLHVWEKTPQGWQLVARQATKLAK
jgi:ketosteroid isomerase-like protein